MSIRGPATGGIRAEPETAAPALGPLAAPTEAELATAEDMLRDRALTLSWAAVALGVQPPQLRALARAGELVAVPGPWTMREAYASGLGFFVPAWQLDHGAREVRPGIGKLVQAAADAGWTSLELHRFMTAPVAPSGEAPAEILRREGVAPVLVLLCAQAGVVA